MALPAFGVLLYLFVQLDIGHRYANRRVQESILSTVQYVPRQTELMARLRTELGDEELRRTVDTLQHMRDILKDERERGA